MSHRTDPGVRFPSASAICAARSPSTRTSESPPRDLRGPLRRADRWADRVI